MERHDRVFYLGQGSGFSGDVDGPGAILETGSFSGGLSRAAKHRRPDPQRQPQISTACFPTSPSILPGFRGYRKKGNFVSTGTFPRDME